MFASLSNEIFQKSSTLQGKNEITPNKNEAQDKNTLHIPDK